MLKIGVLLIIYALLSFIVVSLIMLVKFLSRAQQAGPAVGEFFHFLFFGVLKNRYRDLLIHDGIEPTLFDELLDRISLILGITFLGGLVLVAIGLLRKD